ncbi:MAG: hypothetical protein IKT83_03655, partial [Bacteroidaceae bacterium]|nr:hypothetical protein [Bacteroidaceae bacterium]
MDINLILASIAVFLGIILILVAILLIAKAYLSPSGNVTVTINGKDKISVPQGGSLLSTLSQEGIFLPSACGGKGSCGRNLRKASRKESDGRKIHSRCTCGCQRQGSKRGARCGRGNSRGGCAGG